MIKIGFDIVHEKYITHDNGTSIEAREAKQVYVGDNLVHLHTKDNTAFTDRITCNGEIKINKDVAGQIEGIRGKTLVWNQYVQALPNLSSTTFSNCTCTKLSDDSIQVTVTSNGSAYIDVSGTNWLESKPNNKYLLSVSYNKTLVSGSSSTLGLYINGGTILNQHNNDFVAKVCEYKNTSSRFLFFISNGKAGDVYIIKTANVIDLTQMFGAGNEPSTVAEFEALFPNDYYPYDAGRLLNFTGVGLKSVGFNLWDEEWEEGSIDDQGNNIPNSNFFRCKNYIPVYPNTRYNLHYGSIVFDYTVLYMFYYDSDKSIIGSKILINYADNVFSTPQNAAYIRFRSGGNGMQMAYTNDICISLSNTKPNGNGTYRPYKSDTAEFDVSTILDGNNNPVFPDGLRRAGNVYDEIVVENGVTKAIKRVGSVDLGTVVWYKANQFANAYYFIGGYIANQTKNIISTRYKITDATGLTAFIQDNIDCSIYISNAQPSQRAVYILDTSITGTTSSTIAQELSGVIVYYALDESEYKEYTLTDIKLPIPYYANGLGTESIVSSSTANPATAPADMDIDYRLEEEEWYGIRWRMTDDTWEAPVRIGNPNLHRTLPLQNMMRRCAIVNGVPKYISDIDPDVYEDGTAVSYSTTDIYVEVPEYYFEATQDADGWCELRLHTKLKTGKRSRLYYPGAWRANEETINSVVTLGSKCYINFANIGNHSSYDATEFAGSTNFVSGAPRGGNQSTAYDATVGNLIGRPRTATTQANFRTRAAANSNRHGIINYDCWCSIMRLFFVEYCTFDSQTALDNTLTVLGFKKGGVGPGVTNVNSTYWDNLNSYNPLIPCGITKYLGNNTGTITVEFEAGTIAQNATIVQVPSYRGIENPFGESYCITDGIVFYGDEANFKNYVYIATDATINNIAYVTPSGTNTTPTGYELLTDALPGGPSSGSSVVNQDWIKKWLWNSNGMFVPVSYGRGDTNYMPDYAWSYSGDWKMLLAGGCASNGSYAGLGCFGASLVVDYSTPLAGTRLLYIPQS